MLPVQAEWQGIRQIAGLSHLEPPKSQTTVVEPSQIGVPTCMLIRALQKIKYAACAREMARNQGGRGELLHLELPKSQKHTKTSLIEPSQIGVPTWVYVCCLCTLDGWEPGREVGIFVLRTSKSQTTSVETCQVGVPTFFVIRVVWITLATLPVHKGWQGTRQMGGDFRIRNPRFHKLH